eukprot:1160573-Pelagomonas_calceolata.AAC.12
MGNSQSARSFLNADPDFGEYVHAEWRSQRAAELDALGGEDRLREHLWAVTDSTLPRAVN